MKSKYTLRSARKSQASYDRDIPGPVHDIRLRLRKKICALKEKFAQKEQRIS